MVQKIYKKFLFVVSMVWVFNYIRLAHSYEDMANKSNQKVQEHSNQNHPIFFHANITYTQELSAHVSDMEKGYGWISEQGESQLKKITYNLLEFLK